MSTSEPQNASLTLRTSVDKMHVLVTVTAALAGGVPLAENQLLEALSTLNIPESQILSEPIQQLLNGEAAEDICIACGLAPVSGEDATFVPLIDLSDLDESFIDTQCAIDFYDTKMYPAVEPETPLMRRLPPTIGVDGTDVFGEAISAVPGKDLLFKSCEGSRVAPQDSDLLLATLHGYPIIELTGVRVANMLVLPSADLDSGHIDFDGSVSIKGDVKPRVEVKATGDIFVKGTVESASLIAGGQIVIGGGVIGETLSDKHNAPKITTRLQAGSDIHAQFLQQVEATAGASILVQRYALHCHLKARMAVVVGERGGKGIILGGWADAGTSLRVNIIGSNAYIETRVSVGQIHSLFAEQSRLALELEQRGDESNRLQEILTKLSRPSTTNQPRLLMTARIEKAQSVVMMLDARIAKLHQHMGKLAMDILEAQAAYIQVNRKLYSNTRVTVNGSQQVIQQEQSKTRIMNNHNQLVFT
ncbi:MAG: hypothetical protein ACI9TP_000462 [Candidatus Azotimanducaceae bacterium]|jgi:uncharacterized protein (DUF342 family)